METSDDNEINYIVEETKVDSLKLSLITSSPKKIKLTCEACAEKSQCKDALLTNIYKTGSCHRNMMR